MKETTIDDAWRSGLIAIVDRDHAQSNDFISRLLTLRTGITALGGSVWTALIGFGITTRERVPFLAGLLLISTLAAVDLTYSAHYRSLRAHVRRLERALNANYKYLYRTTAREHSGVALRRALAGVEVGQIGSLSPLGFGALRRAIDARFWMFAGLAVASAALAIYWSDSDEAKTICLQTTPGAVVRVEKLREVTGGQVLVVPCPARLGQSSP